MNFQPDNGHQQQQTGNGCSRQDLDQNRSAQRADGPETQTLPMPAPVPDPPIQYTKVRCTQRSRVKAIKAEPNMQNDPSSSLVHVSLSLEGNLCHNKKAWIHRSPYSLTDKTLTI